MHSEFVSCCMVVTELDWTTLLRVGIASSTRVSSIVPVYIPRSIVLSTATARYMSCWLVDGEVVIVGESMSGVCMLCGVLVLVGKCDQVVVLVVRLESCSLAIVELKLSLFSTA